MEKVTVIDSEKYQQYEQQIQQVIADIDYLRKHQQAAPKVIYTNKDMLELLGVNVKTLKKYRDNGFLAYIIHSGFISGYQNRYGDNLKPPTNVYHRMTA